jgi:O-acetylserine/cysteine efflux transporter
VTPMALLVPIFGMGASTLWLGEPLPSWKVVAALLVMAGLSVNVLWPRLQARWRAKAQ